LRDDREPSTIIVDTPANSHTDEEVRVYFRWGMSAWLARARCVAHATCAPKYLEWLAATGNCE
jgi:hypothetical protein